MVALFLGAIGQLLMKYGMDTFKQHHEVTNYVAVLRAMFQVACVIGLVCYFLSSVVYLKLLASMPLSLLYPMVALNYVIVTFLTWLIFKEHVPPLRIIGLATIICGVAMVGLSESKSAPAAEAGAAPAGVEIAPGQP